MPRAATIRASAFPCLPIRQWTCKRGRQTPAYGLVRSAYYVRRASRAALPRQTRTVSSYSRLVVGGRVIIRDVELTLR